MLDIGTCIDWRQTYDHHAMPCMIMVSCTPNMQVRTCCELGVALQPSALNLLTQIWHQGQVTAMLCVCLYSATIALSGMQCHGHNKTADVQSGEKQSRTGLSGSSIDQGHNRVMFQGLKLYKLQQQHGKLLCCTWQAGADRIQPTLTRESEAER